MRPFALAVTIAVAGVLGLAAAPVPKVADKPALYFPTKVGTKWVYAQPRSEMTLVVTKVEAADDTTLVTVERVVGGGKSSPIHTVRVGKAGVAFTSEVGEAYTPPWVRLRLPHRAGEKWESASSRTLTQNGAVVRFHSAATDRGEEEVQVPAGTFRALRVDSEWSADGAAKQWKREWFAVGVGAVKMEWASTVCVLKSFSLGKD
jgi:hypothetical protein